MPKFSICVITRNEENTLPRLLKSLEEFKSRGGEVCILDTGSTDNTVRVATDWGCKVKEVGEQFLDVLDKEKAYKINERFEAQIVKEGDKSFFFANARNLCAEMASNDIIAMPDADEIYTKMNIDEVNRLIDAGYEQLEFNFVFAHGPNGEETIKFIQCKMYDRRKMKWTGRIHEVLVGNAKRTFMPEHIYKIEHYQNESTDRKSYLIGLAIDCYDNPTNDRNSHYFARELMWRGFPEAAIKEFKRHLTISWWDQERSQSMIFIGDILMGQGKDKEAIEWYQKAYNECPSRRSPLIRLGEYYFKKNDWSRAIFYLEGCLNIPYSGFYADDMSDYGDKVYGMLYVAYWWFGNKIKSRNYFKQAIEMNPYNLKYLSDRVFYEDTEENNIEGWMSKEELNFLEHHAKQYNEVIEIGSWKGRSTWTLLKNCKGTVHSVDTFLGSEDPLDTGHMDVYPEFIKNVGYFENLKVHRGKSVEMAKEFKNNSADMVFIDAGHQYHEVKEDIEAWLPKCKTLLCGHDYNWPPVAQAVKDTIGEPDGVQGSIWWKYLDKSFVKRGDGEEACMAGVNGENCDGSKYHPELGEKLKEAYEYFETRPDVEVVYFDDQATYNKLLHRKDNDVKKLKKFYEGIRDSGKLITYVCPDKLLDIVGWFEASHISVPERDAYVKYGRIKEQLLKAVGDNEIVLFSCGMMAKPLIAECLKKFKNIRCLDLGSAFDPIAHESRTEQISTDEIRELYGLDLPTVSILIPTLGRPAGLKRCLDSIKKLDYPINKLQLIIEEDDPRLGVARRLNGMVNKAIGKWLVYGSNDIEFTPDCLREAVKLNKDLVAFNTGEVLPDEGNICEHFMIKRKFVEEELGGKIFDEDFNHVGVDNLLWAKVKNKVRADKAVIIHHHFSKGSEYDDIYKLGWEKAEEDRELLKEKINNLI